MAMPAASMGRDRRACRCGRRIIRGLIVRWPMLSRRLTRADARSVEQSVSLDDGDEIYNWPWLYAVQVGEWGLTQKEADKLRDYLLRGGFFMADDCHGSQEQAILRAHHEDGFS